MLVVDGTDPELVRGILETDMVCLETRHKDVIKFGKMGRDGSCLGYDWYPARTDRHVK